jgi:hypothetical protein
MLSHAHSAQTMPAVDVSFSRCTHMCVASATSDCGFLAASVHLGHFRRGSAKLVLSGQFGDEWIAKLMVNAYRMRFCKLPASLQILDGRQAPDVGPVPKNATADAKRSPPNCMK